MIASLNLLSAPVEGNAGIFDPMGPARGPAPFDEGPRRSGRVDASPGSINTQVVDAYTQGVEITRQSMYDAGLAKVWSGDPGHVHLQSVFGEGYRGTERLSNVDNDRFDPVTFLRAQEHDSPLWWNIITFPIDVGDPNVAQDDALNGVIEPLTIRAIAEFSSIEAPFESHTVRGALSSGNVDCITGAEQVLSVDSAALGHAGPYLDLIEYFGALSTISYFVIDPRKNAPFVDGTLSRSIRDASLVRFEDPAMVSALSGMKPSTDNYISTSERSSACGWYYEASDRAGTDSLAFGGMVY